MQKNTYILFIVFILIAALGGGAFGSYLTASQFKNGQINDQNDLKPDKNYEGVYIEESEVIDTVKEVSPSVVSIVISKDLPLYRQGYRNFGDSFSDPFFNFGIPFQEYERNEQGEVQSERVQIGGGSGFIMSEDGLIVTNRHVVEDEEAAYTVITNDGREFDAKVLARDTISDFAVLKLVETDENKIENLTYAKLGDSDATQIGQKVVAIGNALSEFQNSVTSGIVSGKGRNIEAGSMYASERLINLIQTDAPINPGNSGGPLVNLKGEVIGINTAIRADAQGIGFAIPINDVKELIKTVQEKGKIIRPFLGVRFMMLDETIAKELEIDIDKGALLVGNDAAGEFAIAPNSPAEEAGLQSRDVITEIDGQTIELDQTLDALISKKKPGDEVSLKVWRKGETIDLKVKLGDAS